MSNFLVTCVNNVSVKRNEPFKNLTKGTQYEVLKENEKNYQVRNDSGKSAMYSKQYFEPVKPKNLAKGKLKIENIESKIIGRTKNRRVIIRI